MKKRIIPFKSLGTKWAPKDNACDYIDTTYTESEEKPVCSALNAGSILGAAAFLIMIVAVPAAVEAEAYITAAVLIAVMAVCAYLSMKEDGKI